MGSYPLSSLPYELGFTLLALALFGAAAILGTVRSILKEPPVEMLTHGAALLLLVSVAIHVYASAAVLPTLESAGAGFDAAYRTALFLKHASITCLAFSGFLAFVSGAWCYRLMNR